MGNEPVTTIEVYLDGHHDVLDTPDFRAELRMLLFKHTDNYDLAKAAIISVEQGHA